jgi:hypothetical protein
MQLTADTMLLAAMVTLSVECIKNNIRQIRGSAITNGADTQMQNSA